MRQIFRRIGKIVISIMTEWRQSQLSIRGQPRTSAPGGQEREHAMRFLLASISRQSQHGLEGWYIGNTFGLGLGSRNAEMKYSK